MVMEEVNFPQSGGGWVRTVFLGMGDRDALLAVLISLASHSDSQSLVAWGPLETADCPGTAGLWNNWRWEQQGRWFKVWVWEKWKHICTTPRPQWIFPQIDPYLLLRGAKNAIVLLPTCDTIAGLSGREFYASFNPVWRKKLYSWLWLYQDLLCSFVQRF